MANIKEFLENEGVMSFYEFAKDISLIEQYGTEKNIKENKRSFHNERITKIKELFQKKDSDSEAKENFGIYEKYINKTSYIMSREDELIFFVSWFPLQLPYFDHVYNYFLIAPMAYTLYAFGTDYDSCALRPYQVNDEVQKDNRIKLKENIIMVFGMGKKNIITLADKKETPLMPVSIPLELDKPESFDKLQMDETMKDFLRKTVYGFIDFKTLKRITFHINKNKLSFSLV
jgi:hypothetical protein